MSVQTYSKVVVAEGRLMAVTLGREAVIHDEPTFYLEKVGKKVDIDELLKPFTGKTVTIIVMEEP